MTLHVALLHGEMIDKTGDEVTTSLTLIDVHDIARSSRTFGAESFYVVHPVAAIRSLARRLIGHWTEGFGATYNANRKDAVERVNVVVTLDDVVLDLQDKTKRTPILIATSAKEEGARVSYSFMASEMVENPEEPYVLLLGTGWGMSPTLVARTDYFLEPIRGVGDYNHLSVRSACAIMLDRLQSAITVPLFDEGKVEERF
jgi:hypothetical protein